MNKRELAKMIDHTLLGPMASIEGVRKLCAEAKEYGFASVCVNPCHAALARELLDGSEPKVCVVIGFPHGMSTSAVKGYEAEKAIADGADELDMVINVAALKSRDYRTVSNNIRAVCVAAEKAPREALVKVILETRRGYPSQGGGSGLCEDVDGFCLWWSDGGGCCPSARDGRAIDGSQSRRWDPHVRRGGGDD